MSELAFSSAEKLVSSYKQKVISPVEATEAALEQIAKFNGQINAYCVVDGDGAIAQARDSEIRWQKGEPKGPLDGVPTSIKDLALTKGLPTRFGSLTSKSEGPWDVDAPFVARLRESGAVILGKTTTPEYGWKGVTDCKLTGATRNPWNLSKTPGGSSGGAAAALASGMCALATGSDGGGSIRIPAGFTGVFGIKMNFGRVPVYPESAMRSLSHAGPMARSVTDAALMANVMCRPDYRDHAALPYQEIDWTEYMGRGPSGLKLGYSRTLGFAEVAPEVIAKTDAAVKILADLGAEVTEADPGFDDPVETFEKFWHLGAAGALSDAVDRQTEDMDPGLVEIVEKGRNITALEYANAMAARTDLALKMREFHQDYDLLVTPALAVTAFDVNNIAPAEYSAEANWMSWTPFTYPFNLTQQPCCSVPCGLANNGLPVGLQFVADNYREDLVLQAASAYETARGETSWPQLEE